eukprot:6186283-Pleurochrysis_carterae.AAC.5
MSPRGVNAVPSRSRLPVPTQLAEAMCYCHYHAIPGAACSSLTVGRAALVHCHYAILHLPTERAPPNHDLWLLYHISAFLDVAKHE